MAISCVSHGTSATIDTAGVSMILLQTINHECIFFSGCESLVLQSINQWGCCAPLLTSNGDDLQMIREKIEMMSIRGKVWEMWRREIPRSYDDGDTGSGWIRNIYQDREHTKYKRFFETTMTKKFTRTATKTSTNETTEILVLGVRIKNIYKDLKKIKAKN